jgi:protein CpxP
MNTSIPRFLFAAALALPLLAPAAPVTTNDTAPRAQAQEMKQHHGHHGHHGKRGHGRHHDHDGKPFFMRGVTLTAEQDSKLQALQKELQPALQAKKEAAHKARIELRQLSLSGKFDEKQAKRLADASAAASAEAELLKARSHAQIVQLLTPEQRQQVEKNLQEKAARHAGKRSEAH